MHFPGTRRCWRLLPFFPCPSLPGPGTLLQLYGSKNCLSMTYSRIISHISNTKGGGANCASYHPGLISGRCRHLRNSSVFVSGIGFEPHSRSKHGILILSCILRSEKIPRKVRSTGRIPPVVLGPIFVQTCRTRSTVPALYTGSRQALASVGPSVGRCGKLSHQYRSELPTGKMG